MTSGSPRPRCQDGNRSGAGGGGPSRGRRGLRRSADEQLERVRCRTRSTATIQGCVSLARCADSGDRAGFRRCEVKPRADTEPIYWWWLSFADSDLPKGSQFLGACIVQGTQPKMGEPRLSDPIPQAHLFSCNPGGEVQFHQIPDDRPPTEEWTYRLLDRDECAEFNQVILDLYGPLAPPENRL